jgi:hypothetical protein
MRAERAGAGRAARGRPTRAGSSRFTPLHAAFHAAVRGCPCRAALHTRLHTRTFAPEPAGAPGACQRSCVTCGELRASLALRPKRVPKSLLAASRRLCGVGGDLPRRRAHTRIDLMRRISSGGSAAQSGRGRRALAASFSQRPPQASWRHRLTPSAPKHTLPGPVPAGHPPKPFAQADAASRRTGMENTAPAAPSGPSVALYFSHTKQKNYIAIRTTYGWVIKGSRGGTSDSDPAA